MLKTDFQKFFGGKDDLYYDSKYLITILERMLENNFDEIKEKVVDAKVMVSEAQIKNFLNKKLEEEDLELKQRVEKRKIDHEKSIKERRKIFKNNGKLSFNWEPLTAKEIEESSKKIADEMAMSRYQFEPYTLKYFNRYIEILKSKLLTLLNVIEQIGNKNTSSIKKLMTELDIVLDENGNISKEDITRLLMPTIYNFEKLNQKVEESNQLSTYLTVKISKHSLMRDGLSEGEIYPTKSLQDHSLYGFDRKENVPLSSRQKQKRSEQQKRNAQATAKLILKL